MKKIKEFIGVILGAIYGVLIRILMNPRENNELFDVFNIYSVSFIWVLPIAISIIPILIARNNIIDSRAKQVTFPILSVVLFFIITLTGGIEDWLCILIISFPFLLTAGIVGLIAGHLIKRRNSGKLLSIVFLPFLLAPIEHQFDNQEKSYQSETSIIISSCDSLIWSYLIEVPEIKEDEYQKGIFQFIGVPRPLKSELKKSGKETYRIGYFSEGLELFETLAEIEIEKKVSFEIHLEKSKLRDTPTDQHILNSDNFRFRKITYQLERISKDYTVLTLKCNYNINSKINWYANFWADLIICDFEKRLLNSLKTKIENDVNN